MQPSDSYKSAREHENQRSVSEWVRETFPRFMGGTGRAAAVVEEAVELALACGMTPEDIRKVVEVPIEKERVRSLEYGDATAGERRDKVGEEVADTILNVYCVAEQYDLNAQAELDAKMEHNRSRPKSYYDAKTAEKEKLGYVLPNP